VVLPGCATAATSSSPGLRAVAVPGRSSSSSSDSSPWQQHEEAEKHVIEQQLLRQLPGCCPAVQHDCWWASVVTQTQTCGSRQTSPTLAVVLCLQWLLTL
jgi:hypothetical protein